MIKAKFTAQELLSSTLLMQEMFHKLHDNLLHKTELFCFRIEIVSSLWCATGCMFVLEGKVQPYFLSIVCNVLHTSLTKGALTSFVIPNGNSEQTFCGGK